MTLPAAVPTRHPMDPDLEPSRKARAVFALGLAGMLTGAFVGGVIPATVALLLARQASIMASMAASTASLFIDMKSTSVLSRSKTIRRGRRLAWAGLVLALTTLVVASIAGLLHLAGAPAGPDFGPGTD